nr:endonuclease-reverse transcriptase HmRTE-e01 [Haemonchus contortus]
MRKGFRLGHGPRPGSLQHLLRKKEVSGGNLQQWRERNGNRSCASKKVVPRNCKRHEGTAWRRAGYTAQIAIDLPKKSRTRTERRIGWWKLHRLEREHFKEKILGVGLPDPEGPIQQTWSNAVKVILGCAKETLGETRGGPRGDKEAWLWNEEVQRVVREKKLAYKRWQKTRALEDLAAYKTSKRLAKAAVAKAKSMEMDAFHEKLDSREGKKFVFRLAKARHRATQDIGVVKSVSNSECAILRKPGEVRRRWKECFDRLLSEEFAR